MKRIPFRSILLPAAFCLGMTTLAHAQPVGPGPGPGPDTRMPDCPAMMEQPMHGRMGGMGPGMGMGMGMRMGPGMEPYHGGPMMPHGGMMGMGPGHLYGIQLSEEQQDRIFNIKHRQEPRLRESTKLLNRSMTALHQLVHSASYTDANAQSLARSIGQASADIALMHAQTHRQIYEVLTPEQRRQLEERSGAGRRGPGGAGRPGCAAPGR